MADEVRLYVLAEFDLRTEERLSNYRDLMIGAGYVGTQTVGINHHVTIGSYPLACRETLRAMVEAERGRSAFPIRFADTGTFGDRVLFIAPEEDEALAALHARFDGDDDWVPHCTMYLTEENGVARAKAYLDAVFTPFAGMVTRLSLYEFFPSKFIGAVDLKSE